MGTESCQVKKIEERKVVAPFKYKIVLKAAITQNEAVIQTFLPLDQNFIVR